MHVSSANIFKLSVWFWKSCNIFASELLVKVGRASYPIYSPVEWGDQDFSPLLNARQSDWSDFFTFLDDCRTLGIGSAIFNASVKRIKRKIKHRKLDDEADRILTSADREKTFPVRSVWLNAAEFGKNDALQTSNNSVRIPWLVIVITWSAIDQ